MQSIVTWNIRHGGGRGERSRQIISQLLSFDATVLVLTEFRDNATGALIKTGLAERGYAVSHPEIPERVNTVLIAARDRIAAAYPLDPALEDPRHLWVVELDWLKLCGVYMPLNAAKVPYWEALLRAGIVSHRVV